MANLYKIRNLAKEKGWSLSYICSKMGVAASYFTDVKNGKLKISPERLQQIADILGTTPEYLTDQTDIKEPFTGSETDKRTQKIDNIMKLAGTMNAEQLARLIQLIDLARLPDDEFQKILQIQKIVISKEQ